MSLDLEKQLRFVSGINQTRRHLLIDNSMAPTTTIRQYRHPYDLRASDSGIWILLVCSPAFPSTNGQK